MSDERFSTVDEAELGRRAAHVECEQVVVSGPRTEPCGGDGPRRRPGLQHPHREPPRLLDVGEPSAREHEEKAAADAAPGHPLREPADVAGGERHQVRVRDGGRYPLELPDLRRDLRRDREREFGKTLRKTSPCRSLVLRIGVGVEEGDRDRVHLVPRELGHRLVERTRVQALQHLAVRSHPFRRLEPPVARHERWRLGDGEVVELVLALATDLQGVAKPPGGDEARARPLSLDERVGEEGCRVHQTLHRARVDPCVGEDARDAGFHTPRRVVVGGQHLARESPLLAPCHDVGKGPADVDPERPHAGKTNANRSSGFAGAACGP